MSGQPELWTKVGSTTVESRWQPLAESASRSGRERRARILAQQPAQSLVAPHRSRRRNRVGARDRSTQIESTMGPSLVVVRKPISQDALKVPTIEDEKPIETFTPGRAKLALNV